MKRVNILNWVNTVNNLFIVEMLGERKLAQNAVDFRVIIKFFDQRIKLLLGCCGRQSIFHAVKAAFLTGTLFIADINLRCGIVADNNNRKTGSNALSFKLLASLLNLLLNCL